MSMLADFYSILGAMMQTEGGKNSLLIPTEQHTPSGCILANNPQTLI